MSTLILSAYRVKKSVDLFKGFLEPSVKIAYDFFRKQDFLALLHEIIVTEARENLNQENIDSLPSKDEGIISGDSVHTYHEIKNKFIKASQKKVSGDPFDQNLKIMIKWDENYYYLKFLINGKISTDLMQLIEEKFDFLEDYTYCSYDERNVRGEVWESLIGTEQNFINFLHFDILSHERIVEWLMEPIFKLPQAEGWSYKFSVDDIKAF